MLLFKRISSTYDDYAEACKTLFETSHGRGYSRSKSRKMKREIWRNPYTPKTAGADNDTFIPIILRYNQFGKKFMHNMWKNIVQTDELFHDYRLVAAYSKNKNLANHLVRAKVKQLDDVRESDPDPNLDPKPSVRTGAFRTGTRFPKGINCLH